MSRERTDADEFSIAMGGAIIVALVLTFVFVGCYRLVSELRRSPCCADEVAV